MGLFDKFKKKSNLVNNTEHERNMDLYLEEVKEAQEEELKSNRYEFVTVFTNLIISNKHKEKEGYLFKLLNKRRFEYIGKEYNIVKNDNLELYDKVIKFLNHLSEEELEENYYLYVAKNVFDAANSDAEFIINDIASLLNNRSRNSMYKRNYAINPGIKELVPECVPLVISHSALDDSIYYANNDPILSDEYIDLYRNYNDYIETLSYLVTNIYSLVIWYKLQNIKEPISLRNIKLLNNSIDITVGMENYIRVRRTYIVDQRIARIIGDYMGIPFETMINMDPKTLTEKLENKNVKKLEKK